MSQVTRLKELLFDNETQALEALSRRIDTVAGAEQLAREVIRRELDTVLDRVGTTERFTRSVTEVIDEALEQAEVAKHTKLSATIAPLVVTTIKTELRNSQDEMVEALYPITGRLVKAYVASAIKDLNAELNRKIEQNAFMLRLQSLTTGRSVAELALAGGRNFKVEELFLIRRGSGELIAHWPETAGGGREQMMSGISPPSMPSPTKRSRPTRIHYVRSISIHRPFICAARRSICLPRNAPAPRRMASSRFSTTLSSLPSRKSTRPKPWRLMPPMSVSIRCSRSSKTASNKKTSGWCVPKATRSR